MESAWEQAYYRELKREKRQEMLKEAIEAEGMSPANELRSKLLEARYGKQINDEGQAVDFFIRGWMTLRYAGTTTSSLFRKARQKKELESLRQDWKFAMVKEYGEIGEEILYQELCNLALVYMELCRNDKNYSAVLLGIGRMQKKSLEQKIFKDMFTVAFEMPELLGAAEELKPFSRAVTNMFCEEHPNLADDFRRKVAERLQ